MDAKKIEDLQKDIETMEKELTEAKKTLRDMRTKGLREAMEAKKLADEAVKEEMKALGVSYSKVNVNDERPRIFPLEVITIASERFLKKVCVSNAFDRFSELSSKKSACLFRSFAIAIVSERITSLCSSK